MVCLSSCIWLGPWQITTDPFVGKVVVGVNVRLLSMFTRPNCAGMMLVTVALNIPHSSTSPTVLLTAAKVILASGHIPVKAEPVQAWPPIELQL